MKEKDGPKEELKTISDEGAFVETTPIMINPQNPIKDPGTCASLIFSDQAAAANLRQPVLWHARLR